MSDFTLGVVLQMRTGDFNRQANQAQQSVRSLGGATENVTRQSVAASNSMNLFSGRVGELAALAAPAIVACLGLKSAFDFGQAIVNAGAATEALSVRLETLTGSSAAAEQALAWITGFTAKTPLQLNDVSKAYAGLIGVGLDAQRLLQPVGDAVAAVGGGAPEIDRVVTALSQMQSKGKASAEELMQIAEVGIPAFQILKESLKLNAEQMNDIGNAGFSVTEIIEALADGMDTRFGGAMARQSQTFAGIMSNLEDQWTQFLSEIADAGFFDYAKQQMQNLLTTVQQLRDDGTLRDYAKTISNAFIAVGVAVEGVIGLVQLLLSPLKGIYELGKLIGSGFADIGEIERQTEAQNSQYQTALAHMRSLKEAQAANAAQQQQLETAIAAKTQALAERKTKFQIEQYEAESKGHQKKISSAEQREEKLAQRIKQLRQDESRDAESTSNKIRELKRAEMSEQSSAADTALQIFETLKGARDAAASGDNETAIRLSEQAEGLVDKLGGIRSAVSSLEESAKQSERDLAENVQNGFAGLGIDLESMKSNNDVAIALLKQTQEQRQIARQQAIKAAESEAAAERQKVDSLKVSYEEIQQKLDKLGQPQKTIITADITQAENEIARLRQQLSQLQSSNISVGSGRAASGGPIPGFATGGFTGGGQLPGYSLTDNLLAMLGGQPIGLSGGEYVINAPRTRLAAPVLDFLNFAPLPDVQQFLQKLPGLASGGPVTPSPNPVQNAGNSASIQTFRLEIGDHGGATLMGEAEEVQHLGQLLQRAAL